MNPVNGSMAPIFQVRRAAPIENRDLVFCPCLRSSKRSVACHQVLAMSLQVNAGGRLCSVTNCMVGEMVEDAFGGMGRWGFREGHPKSCLGVTNRDRLDTIASEFGLYRTCMACSSRHNFIVSSDSDGS